MVIEISISVDESNMIYSIKIGYISQFNIVFLFMDSSFFFHFSVLNYAVQRLSTYGK